MASALYSVVLQTPTTGTVVKNVLATSDSTHTALQVAIATAMAAVPGATLQNAGILGGRSIDISIVADNPSPTERALYQVQFQTGSGPGGSSPQPIVIYANAATGALAYDLALQTAAQSLSAVPAAATLIGMVDIVASTGATAPVTLTKLQFRALFTLPEQIAIDNYAASSLPADVKATITTIMATFGDADTISLSDPLVIQGINYLAAVNLLTTARAADILANRQAPATTTTTSTTTS